MFAFTLCVVLLAFVLVAGSSLGLPVGQNAAANRDADVAGVARGLTRVEDESDDHPSPRSHILDHILHEIERGHVTSHSMEHWQEQVNHALKDGELTQDDIQTFMTELNKVAPDLSNGQECCMFG